MKPREKNPPHRQGVRQRCISQSVYPNVLDHPLMSLGHDIPNLSGSPLGNGYGFTVMPHCNDRLIQNVSIQEMALWANIIGMEII